MMTIDDEKQSECESRKHGVAQQKDAPTYQVVTVHNIRLHRFAEFMQELLYVRTLFLSMIAVIRLTYVIIKSMGFLYRQQFVKLWSDIIQPQYQPHFFDPSQRARPQEESGLDLHEN